LGNQPLRESVVNASAFSGPNQPFFDELLFQ
jgi:hypothetical protein